MLKWASDRICNFMAAADHPPGSIVGLSIQFLRDTYIPLKRGLTPSYTATPYVTEVERGHFRATKITPCFTV